MRNVMVRWDCVVNVSLILILGLSNVVWTKKISLYDSWDRPKADFPSSEWQPLVINRPNGNSDIGQQRRHFTGNDQQPFDQQIQRTYHLAQTQSFPPNNIISSDYHNSERKSFQLASAGSVNRLENAAAPTILGAFNSIGLRMVQNRVPSDKHVSGPTNKINGAQYTAVSGPSFHGKLNPSFPREQFWTPTQHQQHQQQQHQQHQQQQHQQQQQQSNYFGQQAVPAKFYQSSAGSLVKSGPSAGASVQAFPPGRQNPFVSDYATQQQQKGPSFAFELNNVDSESLSSSARKQMHPSPPLLLTDNSIPTIYGTRDTFNLPAIFKPAPFTKSPQFEEQQDFGNFYKIDEAANSRSHYRKPSATNDERNPGKQVYDQLSKYGRPFAAAGELNGNYNNNVDSDNSWLPNSHRDPEEPDYGYRYGKVPSSSGSVNSAPSTTVNFNGPHPTVKSGKYAIQTNYKGERNSNLLSDSSSSSTTAASTPEEYDYKVADADIYRQKPLVSTDSQGNRYAQLEIHSSPITFSGDERQQHRHQNLSPSPSRAHVEIQNWNSHEYKSVTKPPASFSSSPFLPTPLEANDDHRFDENQSVTIDLSTIPPNHKYVKEHHHRQKDDGYHYRYKEMTRRTKTPLTTTTTTIEDFERSGTTPVPSVPVDSDKENYAPSGAASFTGNAVGNGKRRKVKPFQATRGDPLTAVLGSSDDANSKENVKPYYSINDAFYDDEKTDRHRQQYNLADNGQQRFSFGAKPFRHNLNQLDGFHSPIENHQHPTVSVLDDEIYSSSSSTVSSTESVSSTAPSTATTTPTSTTTVHTTLTSTATGKSKLAAAAAAAPPPGKGKQNSTRPKFSLKDYNKARTDSSPVVTTTSTEAAQPEDHQQNGSTTRKPPSSRYKVNNGKNDENTESKSTESSNDQQQQQQQSVRKYKPRPKTSRYRTTSATVNPLLETTTSERTNTFRPTGVSRYKSGGTRNYSKYRTSSTTEATSNDLEDELPSSSNKHTVRAKPVFSAKRSNILSRRGNSTAIVQKESGAVSSEDNFRNDNDSNQSASETSKKTIFPKKDLLKSKGKLKAASDKSDDEQDIKIMTSSEEVAEKNVAGAAVRSTTATAVADSGDWEYYDDDNESSGGTTISASASENRVINVVHPSSPDWTNDNYYRNDNNNAPQSQITDDIAIQPIQSSSLSRSQSSFVVDESMPPVDAYFRSWYDSEKRKKQ